MDNNNFLATISQVAEEKNIPPEVVLSTVEDALAAAYRKDFGQREQLIKAEIDPETMRTRIFMVRKVVEEVEEPAREITLKEAKKIDKKAKLGGEIREELSPPAEYGRVAAQTAKQVVLQRFREAERDMVFQEYKDKEGTLINGTVQRIEGDVVMVDIGKTSGILFPSEQSKSDRYYVGQRFKVYIVKVEETGREPRVLVSRAHPDVIRRLFEMEVPEITAGTVEIKAVSREAGVRSKVAVVSHQETVDPVGSLVGKKGVRVQAVMSEIGEEKIDIILWSEDPVEFITNALAPAQIKKVVLNEKNRVALIKVNDDQLSLAIGRGGQNVRLASKLTGWQIEIEKKKEEASVDGEEILGKEGEISEMIAKKEEASAKEESKEEIKEGPEEVSAEPEPFDKSVGIADKPQAQSSKTLAKKELKQVLKKDSQSKKEK